jgi:hypothetical protein
LCLLFKLYICTNHLTKNPMNIKFLDAKEFEANLKCTVQSNGKLNFSASAIKIFELHKHKSVKFAVNEDAKGVEELYIVIQDHITDDAFKVNKAGNYYYLNAKALFDSLGIDYRAHSVIYDITKTEQLIDGLPLYKLNKRKGKTRKSK